MLGDIGNKTALLNQQGSYLPGLFLQGSFFQPGLFQPGSSLESAPLYSSFNRALSTAAALSKGLKG